MNDVKGSKSELDELFGHKIYLDYNATTPIHHVVIEAINDACRLFFNPSSNYDGGKCAKAAIQNARLHVAQVVGSDVPEGEIKCEDVVSAIRPNTILVTVMLANNETGVIQPVKDIAIGLGKMKSKIFIHTDASQAIGKIIVDVDELGVDYLTITGHKFYGPRIGALYARSSAGQHGGSSALNSLIPMFYGGGQENGLRSGTENTPMIVGLGKASELVSENIEIWKNNLKKLRDHFETELKNNLGSNVSVNFGEANRLPNTSNVCFPNLSFSSKQLLLKMNGLIASTGAACHSNRGDSASSVLVACGVAEDDALRSIRCSIGCYTTNVDVDNAVRMIVDAVIESS